MEKKTVIVACSPYGNSKSVLSVLEKAGLRSENNTFAGWHDQIFAASNTADPQAIDLELLQGSISDESIAEFLSNASTDPLMLADDRCLWLLDFWAEKMPEARFLLFYSSVESALAFACQQKIEPEQVLAGWKAAGRQLINFQRRHRRQAILIDMEAAVRQPRALIDICRNLGFSLESPPENSVPIAEPAVFERYLARSIVADQQDVQLLQAELEASAQPVEDGAPPEKEPLQLFKELSLQLAQKPWQQQELNETAKRLQSAEHELIEQETRQVLLQGQIDQLIKDRDEQIELNSENLVRLDILQRENHSVQQTAKRATQENELTLLQLHQVQEELEKMYLQKQELEQQQDKDQNNRQQLQAKIEQLTKDLDKQLALNSEHKPQLVNAQQKIKALEQTAEETNQENELLLLQLHQVQEELEKTFLLKQQLGKQIKQEKSAQQQLRARIDQLNIAHDKQVKLDSEHQAQLKNIHHKFQTQIDTLTQSHDKQVKVNAEQKSLFENLQQKHQVLVARLDGAAQKNDHLLLQLHELQEQLEQALLQKEELEQKIGKLRKTAKNELSKKERELNKYRQKITNLKQSLSWKITTPIRAIKNPFKKLDKEKEEKVKIALLRSSGLFDEEWYVATNKDIAKEGFDPVEHYIRYGAAEGRDPSPTFSTRRYLEIHPDVAEAGLNPLVHYVKHGMGEQRPIG